MGGSTALTTQIDELRDGVAVAADALGQPRPDMPPAPDGLPTLTEISAVMGTLRPGNGFDRSFRPSVEASRTGELVRQFKG